MQTLPDELPDELPAAPEADADGVQQIHVAGFCSLKDVVLEPGRLTFSPC